MRGNLGKTGPGNRVGAVIDATVVQPITTGCYCAITGYFTMSLLTRIPYPYRVFSFYAQLHIQSISLLN